MGIAHRRTGTSSLCHRQLSQSFVVVVPSVLEVVVLVVRAAADVKPPFVDVVPSVLEVVVLVVRAAADVKPSLVDVVASGGAVVVVLLAPSDVELSSSSSS